MVGVAGKSKACSTCKKRRIKCDENKPLCKRCEKSGYLCGGYSTGVRFVKTSTGPSRTESQSQSLPTIGYMGKTPVMVVPRMRTAEPPRELSLIAFQSFVCVSFLMHNFVWRTYGHGWLAPAAQKQLNSLSTQAVRALSNIFFGIEQKQEDIQLQACLQYGKALKGLRGRLEDLGKAGVEGLIVPVLLMLMHASYEEDQAAAISHVRGLIMLLRVAGPHKFQQDPLRKAFESSRATLATSFIVARQPLFLSEDSWKTVPWALDPQAKSEQNRLVDILVDVPGFLADDDQLHNCPLKARIDLVARIEAKLFELYCWRYTWDISHPDAVYEKVPPDTEARPRAIKERLHFRSHELAAEVQIFNAIHLFLFGLLERLSDSGLTHNLPLTIALNAAEATSFFVSSTPPTTDAILLPHSTASLRSIAIEVVRIFEYQMQNAGKVQSSNLFFLFPLGIAWEVLKEEDEYKNWMRMLLDKESVTSGYAVGRNRWFGKYYLPKVGVKRNESQAVRRDGSVESTLV